MDPPTKMGRSLVRPWAIGKHARMFINEFGGNDLRYLSEFSEKDMVVYLS